MLIQIYTSRFTESQARRKSETNQKGCCLLKAWPLHNKEIYATVDVNFVKHCLPKTYCCIHHLCKVLGYELSIYLCLVSSRLLTTLLTTIQLQSATCVLWEQHVYGKRPSVFSIRPRSLSIIKALEPAAELEEYRYSTPKDCTNLVQVPFSRSEFSANPRIIGRTSADEKLTLDPYGIPLDSNQQFNE